MRLLISRSEKELMCIFQNGKVNYIREQYEKVDSFIRRYRFWYRINWV